MPSDTLSELCERILLAVWKLNGSGKQPVGEETLRAELSVTGEEFTQEMQKLQAQGFIVKENARAGFALTPLGLAILRQIEEDKLQELG